METVGEGFVVVDVRFLHESQDIGVRVLGGDFEEAAYVVANHLVHVGGAALGQVGADSGKRRIPSSHSAASASL